MAGAGEPLALPPALLHLVKLADRPVGVYLRRNLALLLLPAWPLVVYEALDSLELLQPVGIGFVEQLHLSDKLSDLSLVACVLLVFLKTCFDLLQLQ